MHSRRIWGTIGAILLSGSVSGQEVSFSGSVQTALVSGRFFGDYQNRDRFTRTLAQADFGNWTAVASQWNYTFCDWHDLDETNLSYRWNASQLKVGRFLNPVGMSTWDDQWYSSFVFVPLLELNTYGTRKIFERTIVGVQMDSTVGPNGFKFSATSSDFQQNQVVADKFDRLSARWTHYSKGTLFGGAILTDRDERGGQEQLLTLDVRHTIPHFIFRGQVISYASATTKSSGFFTEATYRRPGWEDLTLGIRHEGMRGFGGGPDWLFATTAAAKIELPFGVTFLANYTFGPDMNRQPLGGGLAFGLSKTVKF